MSDQPTLPGAYPYGPPPPPGPAATPVGPAQVIAQPIRRPASAWRVVKTIFFILVVLGLGLSLLLNLALLGLMAVGGREGDRIVEERLPDYDPAGVRDLIALIEVEGVIESGRASTWGRMIDRARRDQRVKAVVLYVNSPGGGMSASDELHARLAKLRQAGKPIVVQMGGVAASGAYYIAMPATEIVAEPTTLTGSIGVLMPHYNIAELLNRYGVKDETFVASGSDQKNAISWTRPTTPEGQQMVQGILDDAYERFIAIVLAGRTALNETQVRRLASGRVYTAQQAQAEGLVDRIGYLDDAIDRARTHAGLTRFRVVRYVRPFSWRSLLLSRAGAPQLTIDPGRLPTPEGPPVLYLWTGWSAAEAGPEGLR